MTKHNSLRRVFLWLVAFVLLSLAYFELFQCFPRNSDDANCALAGFDMLHGNVWLRHWRFGPDHFYTSDVLAYGILTRLFGLSFKVLFLLPAFYWAAVVLLSLKSVFLCGSKPHSAASIAFTLTLIGLPILPPQSRAPMHIGTLVYCLVIFLLSRRLLLSQGNHPIEYLATFVLTTAAVEGDPLAVVACVLPILITCGLIAAPQCRTKAILVACVLVAATITARVALSLITKHGGFQPAMLPMRLGDFDKFGMHLHYGSIGLLDIFGIDFFGKGAVPSAGYTSITDYFARGPIVQLLRFPLAVFAAASVLHFGRDLYRRFVTRDSKGRGTSNDYLLHFSFWAVTLTVLGAFLTEVLEGAPPPSRFFIPVLVFATIIGATGVDKRWWGKGYTIAVLAMSLLAVGAGYKMTKGAGHHPNASHQEVAAWLQAHSLTEGYGSYWSSSIITVLTSNEIRVRALAARTGNVLAPYLWWNCNTAWYTMPPLNGPPRRFVLIDRPPFLGSFTQEQVIATLGSPAEAVPVGQYVVFIYDVGTTDFSKLVSR